jgi:hypothetical protein
LGPCVRDEREEVKIKKGEKEERKRRIKRRVRARNEEKNREEKIWGFEIFEIREQNKFDYRMD